MPYSHIQRRFRWEVPGKVNGANKSGLSGVKIFLTEVKSISVVGLGKLGLCLAAILASRGYEVHGVDIDKAKVDAINKCVSPIYEPSVQDLLRASSKHMSASTTFSGIDETDATFVFVPTPSDNTGAFSLRFVERAMESVAYELAAKKGYHLVVLMSTVMPGSMDGVVRPLLERIMAKACGRDFGLCYNPEFVAIGDVVRGLLEPDFVLIGQSDQKAGDLLSEVQTQVTTNSPSIERMEFVNAELAKIAVNSFVTMKMSFANTLAELAEKISGGNVDKITSAIGKDGRIGMSYFKGALGYGGPCFPRDNLAFSRCASTLGVQAHLAEASHEVNIHQLNRVINLVQVTGRPGGLWTGVLGLAYKPNTNVVEESQSLLLAQRLGDLGYKVKVYDPASMEAAKSVLGDKVVYAKSAAQCVKESQYVILATPWPDFRKIPPDLFSGKTVLDCWRFLGEDVRRVSNYIPLGFGQAASSSS